MPLTPLLHNRNIENSHVFSISYKKLDPVPITLPISTSNPSDADGVTMKHKLTIEELAVIQAKPVLTVQEAAILAGVSIGSIYKAWKKPGGGPQSFKLGRARRIRRTAFDRWLTDQEKQKAR